MKMIVGRTELLSVLNTCSKSVKNGFVIATSCFRFQLVDDILTISACNLETSTSKSLKVQSLGDDFDVLIPADQLKRYLSFLADQPVTFSFERFENEKDVFYNVLIKTADDDCKINGYDGGDNFPVIKTTGGEKFNIQFEDLHEAIYRTSYAMASNDDHGETVNKLSAVNLSLSKKGAEFASFNGYSFALHKIPGVFQDATLLLPDGVVNIIYNLTLKGDCEIEYSDKSISITVSGLEIKSMLKADKFVDYEKLITIPKTYTNFNRLELISAIKRVLLFSNKTSSQIAVDVNENTITITGEDIDFNHNANARITCSPFDEPIKIGLNGNFTIEALSKLSTNDVYMFLSQPHKPVIFMEEIDGDSMSLLAPVTINN